MPSGESLLVVRGLAMRPDTGEIAAVEIRWREDADGAHAEMRAIERPTALSYDVFPGVIARIVGYLFTSGPRGGGRDPLTVVALDGSARNRPIDRAHRRGNVEAFAAD